MLFNSFHFVVYFIVTTILFFLLPHRFRWAFLLLISCYFYMIFKPEYILILLFTILVDYAAGILIETQPRHGKLYLWLSIIINVGFLCFFKYWNFFNENLTVVLDQFGLRNQVPYLHFLLPIGLSFHTFQALAYTIEVYRGNQKAERHFGIFSLYVMFYPQLVAGPIERPQNTLHQFHEKVDFDYDRVVDGLRQALWGLFKKVVIADRLSIYVDSVFRFPEHHSGVSSLIAAVFFMFQIYCDFSGYSDIALGTARVLGIRLMTNFHFPLFSRNVSELWRRWHISLSTWFNDYLFTPTVTVLRDWGKWAVALGLMLTFFTSGLWHGAGWTYIIFGVMNGVAVTYEFLTKKSRKKFFKKLPDWAGAAIGVLFTFSWFVLAHIFFRAANVGDALVVIRNIFTWKAGPLFIGNAAGFVYSVAGILFLLAADINEKILHNKYSLMYGRNPLLRKFSYVFLILLILGIGVFNGGQFIYFQF